MMAPIHHPVNSEKAFTGFFYGRNFKSEEIAIKLKYRGKGIDRRPER